jgi:hypothetical protein
MPFLDVYQYRSRLEFARVRYFPKYFRMHMSLTMTLSRPSGVGAWRIGLLVEATFSRRIGLCATTGTIGVAACTLPPVRLPSWLVSNRTYFCNSAKICIIRLAAAAALVGTLVSN